MTSPKKQVNDAGGTGEVMKFLKIIIRLFLLFLFISAFVPPLFHKKADVDKEQSKATGSSAQERVLILDDNTEALL